MTAEVVFSKSTGSAEKIESAISECQAALATLREALQSKVVGQDGLIEHLLIALLTDGHVLLEGPPGLAKTRTIHALSDLLEGEFKRAQFTPDLLPSDITGTEIFNAQKGEFQFRPGPLFCNMLLADEINRAPAKVQSALLEAMGERQVTVAGTTYPLPRSFMVMATQNPLEQEGTYPLPEAQLDRFMLHIRVDYPQHAQEKLILKLVRNENTEIADNKPAVKAVLLSEAALREAQREVMSVYLADSLEDYLVALVMATRNPAAYGDDLKDCLTFGASPRATIALDRAVRAKAWLQGRDFVTPDDIQEMLPSVLRHRIGLSYIAEANGLDKDQLIATFIARVAVP
ncbi:AAA family ATPase [Neptunomonas antarctica]|uniref:MoxR-like ATPase n=1 Tax=Neptunomonas antarctica TaxID=619304 RepID=A0A1N7MMQ0_9GAMM|nr:MoxR family ATPase [Neptunomonas antarctica]SIS87310.1 MoxR-like ATPase [Neptunomonas antarctica]